MGNQLNFVKPVTVGTIPGDAVGRICGRVFTAIDDDNTHMATVCSKQDIGFEQPSPCSGPVIPVLSY